MDFISSPIFQHDRIAKAWAREIANAPVPPQSVVAVHFTHDTDSSQRWSRSVRETRRLVGREQMKPPTAQSAVERQGRWQCYRECAKTNKASKQASSKPLS